MYISVVILWLPTFYDPPLFFPQIYEPPVYLEPPFWRKCQPPNVWCSALQTTDQVTRGKGLFCCPEDACQKSCRQQLTLADKIKLGYTEWQKGGFKAVHQVSFRKSEGDNHERKKASAESGWWLFCPSRRGSFLGWSSGFGTQWRGYLASYYLRYT